MQASCPNTSQLGEPTPLCMPPLVCPREGQAPSRLQRNRVNPVGAWFAAFVIFGAQACASEVSLPEAESRRGIEAADAAVTQPSEPTRDPSRAEVRAPGVEAIAYPSGPYGTKLGATIENMDFYGWRTPSGVNFDLARAETLRFSDYYNSAAVAGQGVEYILLNVVASWCSVCRREYTEMATNQVYASLAPRGLEIIGVLYEDNNSDPSRFVDMSNWAQAFSVAFPFVNDPGFKTGKYFDRSATPMNMLIDARSMQIVQVATGYRPSMFEEIDAMLKARGR